MDDIASSNVLVVKDVLTNHSQLESNVTLSNMDPSPKETKPKSVELMEEQTLINQNKGDKTLGNIDPRSKETKPKSVDLTEEQALRSQNRLSVHGMPEMNGEPNILLEHE